MSHFEDNGKVSMDTSHPADAIPHFLAGANKDSTLLRVKQLENWYREYVEVRNNTQLYKGCADFVLSLSSDFQYKQINEYIHAVLEGHKFHIPIFTKVLDKTMEGDTAKLPLVAMKLLAQ